MKDYFNMIYIYTIQTRLNKTTTLQQLINNNYNKKIKILPSLWISTEQEAGILFDATHR